MNENLNKHSNSINIQSCHGYFIMYKGCPLIWKPQLQQEIALSSTESEYYNGLSYVLHSSGPKHSEVKIMYLQELKEKGTIRVYWHPTEENESDIYTQNMKTEDFERHVMTLYGEDYIHTNKHYDDKEG
jgi:enolase